MKDTKQEIALELRNVSKIYSLKSKEKKNRNGEQFYALKNLNVQIPKGEVVGILGTNGSGKSTLSVVLAGISEIDEGELIVNGEQALIAINTGLNNQLTGLENIELKGALLGLSKKRVKEMIEDVIEFAEIGDFLYQPVKKYSSGMKSRLGFSINLALDPDILIVDEALSVGDKGFAKKCLKKMRELKESGKTIIFISHTLEQVKKFCDTALWIEAGEMKSYGEVNQVCEEYACFIEEYNSLTNKQKKARMKEKFNGRIIEQAKKQTFFGKIFG